MQNRGQKRRKRKTTKKPKGNPYNRVATVLPYEVLDHITSVKLSKTYFGYEVWMNSKRYHTFKKSLACAKCGLTGTFFALEKYRSDYSSARFHFNLYAKTSKGEVLMTKDHIIPKSKGGSDKLSNLQTMCRACNVRKGNKLR